MRGCTDFLIMRTFTHKRSKAVHFRRGERVRPAWPAILEVEVLLRADHSEQREVQLSEVADRGEEVRNESVSR